MKKFLAALCAALLIGSGAYAALDLSEVAVGARPLGMGKAYVGLADDASAVFLNPAGLGVNDSLNLNSMTGQMLGDVNYVMLAATDLSPIGKIGIGYVNAASGSIPITTVEAPGTSLETIRQIGLADYTSSLIVFSYGSRLSRFLRNGAGDNFSLGLNLKFFLQGFSGGGTTLQDATGSGMDADFGLLWGVNDWATLGLDLQNCLPDSMGGRFIWQKNGVTESIPMVTRLGGHFSIIGLSSLWPDPEQTLDLMLDYESQQQPVRPAVWHLGAEYRPLRQFVLRAGLDQKAKAEETGTGVDNNLTLGVGLLLGGITFDYAYHQYGELSENGTHFFSLGFRGGEDRREARERQKLEKKGNSSVPVPEIVAKPPLKSFVDVPSGYWAEKPIKYLATLGIMDGYDDGTFRPTKEITRGELAVLLVRAKGFSVDRQDERRFNDVPPQGYEAPYISMAAERSYIKGFSDGTFQPEKRVTRAEAAQIFARFAGLYVKPKVATPPFADLPKNHWATPAITACKENGFFAYLSSGQGFGPNLYVTRAEAAEMIAKTPFAKDKIERLISGEQ